MLQNRLLTDGTAAEMCYINKFEDRVVTGYQFVHRIVKFNALDFDLLV